MKLKTKDNSIISIIDNNLISMGYNCFFIIKQLLK
jgi:hypothetical protein